VGEAQLQLRWRTLGAMATYARHRRHRRGVLDQVVSRRRAVYAARCLLGWTRAVKTRKGLARCAARVHSARRRHTATAAFSVWFAATCGERAFQRRLATAYNTVTRVRVGRALTTWRSNARALCSRRWLLRRSALKQGTKRRDKAWKAWRERVVCLRRQNAGFRRMMHARYRASLSTTWRCWTAHVNTTHTKVGRCKLTL